MRFTFMIEVFDARTGKSVLVVRWRFVARLYINICSLFGVKDSGWWDYNQEGQGWVDGR